MSQIKTIYSESKNRNTKSNEVFGWRQIYIYIYIATKIKEMNQFIEFLVACDWSK
jgi:hypothetical protein